MFGLQKCLLLTNSSIHKSLPFKSAINVVLIVILLIIEGILWCFANYRHLRDLEASWRHVSALFLLVNFISVIEQPFWNFKSDILII